LASVQAAYKFAEIFVNQELAIISEMTVDQLLAELNVTPPPTNVSLSPGDLSAGMRFLMLPEADVTT
jgi:hypothetical protein